MALSTVARHAFKLGKFGAFQQCHNFLHLDNQTPGSRHPIRNVLSLQSHRVHVSSVDSSPPPTDDFSTVRAEELRSRVPKALNALNVYIRDHYPNTKTSRPGTKENSDLFKSLVNEFKNLTPNEASDYTNRAKATQDARQSALKSLTNDEKLILFLDNRRKLLRKKISACTRELNILKEKLKYPDSKRSTAYGLFCKEFFSKSTEKGKMTEIAGKVGQAWKSASSLDRAKYENVSSAARVETKKQLESWRKSLLKDRNNESLLTRFDELKSDIRKYRRLISKISRSQSIEEAVSSMKPKLKTGGVRKTKKKILAKKKKAVKAAKQVKKPRSNSGKSKEPSATSAKTTRKVKK